MQSQQLTKFHFPDPRIKGLSYLKQFISKQQQTYLINSITKADWNTSLKRRTQHYGYEYTYNRKNILNPAPPLPEWSLPVKHRIEQLLAQFIPTQKTVHFNQLIINEYQPGQGINPHIDNPTLFGSPIVSVSLGSQCIMEFDHSKDQDCIEVLLEKRSIFVLDEAARYEWKHSIPGRKKDEGKVRGVRYSLTFRTVKNGEANKIQDQQVK